MERAPTRHRSAKRDTAFGVTSDGVRIPRPPRGRGNLSAAQIRTIVDGLVKATKPVLQASEERRQRLLDRLEPQDRQALLDVADGIPDAEIARRLGMSAAELDRRLKRAMAHVGAHDRGELVSLLFSRAGAAE